MSIDSAAAELIPARVLVVDDDPIMRTQLKHLASRFVAEVQVAGNGAEGLEVWRSWRPNVTVTDILMPVMDGLDMTRAIKAEDPNAQIIVVTSDQDHVNLRRALDIGVERYIQKPVDVHLLMDAVRKCLRDLQQSEELRLTRQVAELTRKVQQELEEKQQAERALRAEQAEQKILIRKLEDAHNQLLQSEKMASLGQLAAGVAHEINNPIGFVSSNLGTLRTYAGRLLDCLAAYDRAVAALPEDSPVRRAVAAARATADADFLQQDMVDLINESYDGVARVRQIVGDLKTFSHVDSTEWQWADLNACLDSTLNLANNEVKYKADVVREYGVLPEVECMPAQLNQVFLNLIVNAVQAMEAHGTLTLRTGSDGDAAWVEVQDNGSGIAPENLKRIFDPFFSTKPVGSGTGLGLSISYGIVRRHGGGIEVRSELGRGTTFRVTVPVRQGKELAAGKAAN